MNERDIVAKIDALYARVAPAPWFVEHGATSDGLSMIEDGRQNGLHSFCCEAHEASFIAALVTAWPEIRTALSKAEAQGTEI
jgi:hypothetical protein